MVAQRNGSSPGPTLYSWSVETDGATGVHADKHTAVNEMHLALRDAPVGAEAKLHEVLLDGSGSCTYVVVRLVSSAQHTAQGTIVWADVPQ